MMNRSKLAAALLATLVVTSACGTGPSVAAADDCAAADVAKFDASSDALVREFRDATDRVGATPRLMLSPVVSDMQTIRRKYRALRCPSCAVEFRDYVDTGMSEAIDGVMALSSGASVKEYEIRSVVAFKAAARARERIVTH